MRLTRGQQTVRNLILCVLLAVTNLFWKLDSCADEMRAELDARHP